MKKKRFSEEKIIRILKEAGAPGNVREACRQRNISGQALYRRCHRVPALILSVITVVFFAAVAAHAKGGDTKDRYDFYGIIQHDKSPSIKFVEEMNSLKN